MFEFKFDIQGSGLPLDILYSSLPCLLDSGLRETAAWQRFDKMVEENVPAPTPTRSNEQIRPFNAWLLALEITLVDSGHPFVSPLAGDQVMDFVNELGYLEEIHFISKMHVNNLYQPWRAILSLINQCLTDKTFGSVKPRYTVIQKLWYIVTRSNVDYAELLRPWSLVHVIGDDFLLGNLKFVPKGEKDEVFGKSIPKELITEAIQNSSYYQQYLEMVARKPTAKEGGQKKTTSKADKPKRPTPVKQLALSEQIKPVKEKTSKPTPSKKIRKGKVMKVCKEKRYDRLVDEEDEEPQSASEPQVEDDEYNLQRGITQRLPVVEGKGKGIATDEQVAQLLLKLQKPKKKNDTIANVVRDTSSPANAKTGADTEKSNSEGDTEILNVDEERGENISNMVALEERTIELDEGQAGSDSGKTPESRPSPEHFLNDKPTEEEPGKANMETKVESLVTVPIHQASSSAPPLSTPIIDLTPPKPVSPPAQEPVFTATTTTTLLPPPPPPQQSTTDPVIAARVSALEQIYANFEKKHKLRDKTTQALSSRVFTLENHDLYLKIENYVNKTVKEAIHNALQVPIRDHFRELSEFEMKEILCDRMFESGTYRSHPEHSTLYEALGASMDRENREEFIEATAKSRKRRRNDQD
ncbi:hypothetical protein Tco_1226751, partial [Tanacetum coccineum]